MVLNLQSAKDTPKSPGRGASWQMPSNHQKPRAPPCPILRLDPRTTSSSPSTASHLPTTVDLPRTVDFTKLSLPKTMLNQRENACSHTSMNVRRVIALFGMVCAHLSTLSVAKFFPLLSSPRVLSPNMIPQIAGHEPRSQNEFLFAPLEIRNAFDLWSKELETVSHSHKSGDHRHRHNLFDRGRSLSNPR